VYLIETDQVILVDTGIPTDMAKGFFYYWRRQRIPPEVEALADDHGFKELLTGFDLAKRDISEVDLLLFTHGHLDHFLMARQALDHFDPVLMAHLEDTPSICNPWGLLNMWIQGRKQMIPTGMPLNWSAGNGEGVDPLHGLEISNLDFHLKIHQPILHEGPLRVGASRVSDLELIHIPGHSPGSIGLLIGSPHERILLCGDTLLNPITPNPDDLLAYLRTLDRLGSLKGVTLTLPAHGAEIRDLWQRVNFLIKHHRNRLKLTFQACSQEKSVWDVASMEGYFDTYVDPGLFNYLAGKEALVHMELLHMVGGLRRVDIRRNVHYFVNSGESFEDVWARISDLVSNYGSKPIMRF
jgi:glyoxylase-like metal-dependent hydrolase (beta-lactamase superfamily II)